MKRKEKKREREREPKRVRAQPHPETGPTVVANQSKSKKTGKDTKSQEEKVVGRPKGEAKKASPTGEKPAQWTALFRRRKEYNGEDAGGRLLSSFFSSSCCVPASFSFATVCLSFLSSVVSLNCSFFPYLMLLCLGH